MWIKSPAREKRVSAMIKPMVNVQPLKIKSTRLTLLKRLLRRMHQRMMTSLHVHLVETKMTRMKIKKSQLASRKYKFKWTKILLNQNILKHLKVSDKQEPFPNGKCCVTREFSWAYSLLHGL